MVLNKVIVTFLTVSEIVDLFEQAGLPGIPEDATFEYGGCGSHEVVLEWKDDRKIVLKPEDEPPPLTPEELAAKEAAAEAARRQDKVDRRMGF